MFDFDSDRLDRRFARPDDNTPPETELSTDAPITRTSNPPVTPPPEAIPIPLPPPIPRAATPARQRAHRRHAPSTVKAGDWAWVVIAVALIFVFIVLGLVVALLLNASRVSGAAPAATPVMALPTPVDVRAQYTPQTLHTGQQLTLDDGSSIVIQPWDGASRLNVLLMGIDRRTGETGLAYRTDTMMLVSLDPKNQRVGILSIPRDLYVNLPGYSQPQRINTALALGEQQRAGFGPTLAMQSVQGNLGMGVNAYVIVDFTALIKLVDAIGGIDIDVPAPIADYQFPDMHYGYSPLILQAGLQHMDGNTAQKYARTRHGSSDFDRAHRQQQVIFAIRDRILKLNAIPQLIIQAPSLYASVSQNVYTDLTLDQMIQLALWLKDVPADHIKTGVIDMHYVSNYTTPDGAEVLVLYPGVLPRLLTQVFGSDYQQQ